MPNLNKHPNKNRKIWKRAKISCTMLALVFIGMCLLPASAMATWQFDYKVSPADW